MPRPKKTEAEIQAMREKIIDVAEVILLEEGPKAITSRAIAERLDMAHMSLFTYFKNQADIHAALRERVLAKARAPLNDIQKRAQSGDMPLLLREIWTVFVNFAQENPSLYRLAWVMPETTGADLETNRQQTLKIIDQLATLLQLGMERGDFQQRDPYLAASTILGIINMPFILFYSGRLVDASLRDRMVDEVLEATMRYLKQSNCHL